jgi:hypothetical protein
VHPLKTSTLLLHIAACSSSSNYRIAGLSRFTTVSEFIPQRETNMFGGGAQTRVLQIGLGRS